MGDNVETNEEVEVCRSFRNNGHCRYADKCKFDHSPGEPIAAVPREAQACFNFRDNGECTHGESCRFTHGDNDPRFKDGRLDVSLEVCRNFQRGRCALGDECPRKHVEREGGNLDGGEGGNRRRRTRRPGPCYTFRDTGACENGEECAFRHFDDEQKGGEERQPRQRRRRKPRAPGPCFDFRDNGNCERGEECKFTHGPDDNRFPAVEETGDVDEEKPRRRRQRKPRENRNVEKLDEVCNNYQLGRCRFGENCRRQHQGDIEQIPQEKVDEICKNYQAGRCSFGDVCRRQHVEA